MSPTPGLLHGRLGLAAARIPQADRHGLLWLEYGRLSVEDGTLRFVAAKSDTFDAGDYAIPYQTVSMILLGPGTSITQDVLRLCARHGTLIAAVGEGGVKSYTAPPMGQGRSDVARLHASLWADPEKRLDIARRLYAWRFGRVLPHRDITVLRGIEGARLKESYRLVAQRYGIVWDHAVMIETIPLSLICPIKPSTTPPPSSKRRPTLPSLPYAHYRPLASFTKIPAMPSHWTSPTFIAWMSPCRWPLHRSRPIRKTKQIPLNAKCANARPDFSVRKSSSAK